MSAGIKSRVNPSRPPVKLKSPLRIVHHSSYCEPKTPVCVPLETIFPDKGFRESHDPRSIFISTATGLPIENPALNPPAVPPREKPAIEVFLHKPIISLNIIADKEGLFRLVTVGCSDRTHYVFVRGKVLFSFYIPVSSVTAQDAIKELLTNNFIKGPCVYNKSSTILQDFFASILSAVYPERTIISTIIKSSIGITMSCRVYFDPAKPKETAISVNGYVYPFPLERYPRSAVIRAVSKLTEEEVANRREAPRSIAHMTPSQQREMSCLMAGA